MAKNRMVRPEMWTDDKFVSLTPLARLLFIGMWNFACDNGHLDDSALQLKMRVLPGDNCDASDLLDELLQAGMVARENGYLKVVNLSTKQTLDLRFLVFCDHCDADENKHYAREDKKGSRGSHASSTRAPQVVPSSARRSGDGDGDGDGERKVRDKRGTRLSPDFALTDGMRTWANERGYDNATVDAITEGFVDYWVGVAGAKGVKLDWESTWRNWVRRENGNVRAIRQPEPAAWTAPPPKDWGPRCPECDRPEPKHFSTCSRFTA